MNPTSALKVVSLLLSSVWIPILEGCWAWTVAEKGEQCRHKLLPIPALDGLWVAGHGSHIQRHGSSMLILVFAWGSSHTSKTYG